MDKLYENLNNNWTNDSVRIINTASIKARDALFYIQEIGSFSTTPGYYAEREHLNSYLLILTTAGKGELSYNGVTYTLKKGDLFWIDCMKRHSYKEDDSEWVFEWLHFNGNISKDLYTLFNRNAGNVIHLDTYDEYISLHSSLKKLSHEPNIRNEIEISLIINQILSKLVLQSMLLTSSTHEANSPSNFSGFDISLCTDYINKHYNESISLDEIASECHISKYYLTRIFKDCMGIGIWDYLTNIRINHAKEQLKSTNYSISYIAENNGVENTSHFINIFKKREGITPLAYRKLWK